MKMNLTVNIEVEGEDAVALLETLLEIRSDPREPIQTSPGTVGNEWLYNKELQLDLEQWSREGGVAFRRIRWVVNQDTGGWLRNMPWNTFILELQKPDGGKIRTIRNIGPKAINSLREVLTMHRIQT